MVTGKKMNQTSPTEPSPRGHHHCAGITRRIAASLLVAAVAIPTSFAQTSKPTEYDVKAAYLLNFGKFVRQADGQGPRASFDICLLGHDAMGQTIDDLAANQAIDNLPVHVRRIPDVTQTKGCSILFISADEDDHLREDLAILSSSDVLTVSDAPDFLDRGGMIQFVLIQNHVRFAVNLNAVNRAHLVLSSELLRVASSVIGKPPTGDPR
ncbi:MAG TPA: YfiR family protein [Terracidiphilus sp.]|nr:YfiR family protein [Terracidiphilus sp.]